MVSHYSEITFVNWRFSTTSSENIARQELKIYRQKGWQTFGTSVNFLPRRILADGSITVVRTRITQKMLFSVISLTFNIRFHISVIPTQGHVEKY